MYPSVYSIITSKTWTSEGIVRLDHVKPPRAGYYPAFGVEFQPINFSSVTIPAYKVHKWDPSSNQAVELQARARTDNTVQFLINEPAQIPSLPAPMPPQAPYKPQFRSSFQNLLFYERGTEILVSSPIQVIDPTIGHGPLTVTFTIEIYESDDKRVKMLQRAIWSDGYQGTYCCS